MTDLGIEAPGPESRPSRTRRALQALRACMRLLVEAASEDDLLARIGPAVQAAGGYREVWIGEGPAPEHGPGLAIPFACEEVRAVLHVADDPPGAFAPDEAAVLEELGPLLGHGLAAQRTAARLRATSEAHRRSEAGLLEAQRIAHIGSWEWDLGTGALAWTDEIYQIFGLDKALVPPDISRFTASIAPEDRTRIRDAIDAALWRGAPYDVQHGIVRPDGTRRVVHERAEVVRDAAGEPLGMVGTVQDVTDLALAQAEIARRDAELAQARELERLRTAFVDAVTHELRGPLTALMGYAELLTDALDGHGGDPRAFAMATSRQVQRMRLLVDDMLDAASMEAGAFRLHREPTALGTVLREVADAYGPLAEAAGVGLAFRAPADLPTLAVDGRRIEQVAANLIDNAIKYARRGGTVEVAVAPTADGGVRVEVRDEGVGIAAIDLPRVFERFGRPGGEGRRGTGLGLSIAKALVEAHGGTIGATSEPGVGSAFWFTLPG